MNTRMAVVTLVALGAIAACGKKNNQTADTTTMPGMDTTTMKVPVAVPTTDTVVKTTTTDTLKGKASDSTKKAATKTKTKTNTKGTKTKY